MAEFGFPVEIVEEGSVKVYVPKRDEVLPSCLPVFFNPVMELNRDLAVLALQAHQKIIGRKVVVCEPMTGCGVRGIRFAVEVKGVGRVFLNDIREEATRLAKFNVKENNVASKVSVENLDANLFLSMYAAPRKRFDYVDVDPFGSPVPYLDSAIRALRDDGILALTATDMAPLCGVHPWACVRKYGGKPLRTEYCHELAVRLLAGCLATAAAKHDVGVRIVFCHSTDHYLRVYAVASYSAQKADGSLKEMGYVLHCFNCFHRETVKVLWSMPKLECPECHGKLSVAGPLWLGKIFDKEFCSRMKRELAGKRLGQTRGVHKLLSLAENEVDAPPTYYVIDKMCDKFGLPVPSLKSVINQLETANYHGSPTHFHTRGIKTTAPSEVMKKVLIETTKK